MPQPNNPVAPVYRTRTEQIRPTETVRLIVTFKNTAGVAIDLDAFPQVSIVSPKSLVLLSPTSSGVYKVGTGQYGYDYTLSYGSYFGVYTDVWQGTYGGSSIEASWQFIVVNSQYDSLNTDGYVFLGDDPGFNYTQTDILNINKLIKMLRRRLNSSGKIKSKDGYGNTIYVDCDIFSVDDLVTFLCMGLSDFNQTPFFTNFQWSDTYIIETWSWIIVNGAAIYAMASAALAERGREFDFSDQGFSFKLPTVSEILNSQYGTALSQYWDQLKYIKASMRPAPLGLGNVSISNGRNPFMSKLRWLRDRRIV